MSIVTRKDLRNMRRVLVKVGTSVIIHSDGSVALGRIGHLVEQIAHILKMGNKEVVIVTSGAVGIGRLKLSQNALLSMPLRTHVLGHTSHATLEDSRSAAAAGQSSLMALYELLFAQKAISCAQVLLTDDDFADKERRANFRNTLTNLLRLGILPILNENDVISTRKTPLRDERGAIFWDNDSLSALVGAEIGAEVVVLLSDVEGLYRTPPDPTQPDRVPDIIHTYNPDDTSFTIGAKSRVGRGGMQAKVEACVDAVRAGVRAVVIASGYKDNVLKRIIEGETVGTIFVAQPSPLTSGDQDLHFFRHMVAHTRTAARQLQKLTCTDRTAVLNAVAAALEAHSPEIAAANGKDLDHAKTQPISEALRARLVLSAPKLTALIASVRAVATVPDPLGRVLSRTELATGLILTKESAPLGVLLVVFESRPDVLPQIAALALRSGNAVILKGGKEAAHTNAVLHRVIVGAIHEATGGRVGKEVLSLIEGREAVAQLLRTEPGVDLVREMQRLSRVPVLGHADGICHVYVHRSADVAKALSVVMDAKTDYPAACNATECILLDAALPESAVNTLLGALRNAKVALHAGPKARLRPQLAALPTPPSLSHEYSDLAVTIEMVESVTEAIVFINKHSSGHTDAIVTEDHAAAEQFLAQVDSASVVHNASTRFADGFRYGLGAEVGISTARVHARGPVGIEGLLTYRYVLRSSSSHTVAPFGAGEQKYTHRVLPLDHTTAKL